MAGYLSHDSSQDVDNIIDLSTTDNNSLLVHKARQTEFTVYRHNNFNLASGRASLFRFHIADTYGCARKHN